MHLDPVNSDGLTGYVRTLRARYGFPGLAIGVLKDGEIFTATDGTLNLATGFAAPPGSMFQIASITKVFTAILAWQLVDEGRLDPDAPLESVLPDFRMADPLGARTITARRLLAHTSGIDGDYLMSDASGPERYTQLCRDIPLLFAPGTRWSYSNAGYVILGHLVEVLSGQRWQELVEARILEPLGMTESLVNPFNLAAYPAAAGHLEALQPGSFAPKTEGCFGESMRPAGSFMLQSARDLMILSRTVLGGLTKKDQSTLLSQKSWQEMTSEQIALPRHNPLTARAWGAGFTLFDDGSLGHAGGTPGYTSFLCIDPETRTAHAILVNAQSRDMRIFLRTTREELFQQLTHRSRPALAPLTGPVGKSAATALCGTYRSAGGTISLTWDESQLKLAARSSDAGQAEQVFRLEPVGDTAFALFDPTTGVRGANITFEGDPQSTDQFWLLYAGRAFRRFQ